MQYPIPEQSRFELIVGGDETSTPVALTAQWMRLGHCQSPAIDKQDIMPDTTDPVAVEAARRICGVCIVRRQCREFALALPVALDEVMWGGIVPEERAVLRMNDVPKTPA